MIFRTTGPAALAGAAVVVLGTAGGAHAALRICNDGSVRQSVSLGYQRDGAWISRGWWNLDPGECVTPIGTALENRYYYYRAEIDGGAFEGNPDYTFCTTPKAFEIVGDGDCEARGYETETFAEIDVGASTPDYTFRLTDAGGGVPPAPAAPPPAGGGQAAEGLQLCNDTALVQAVSVGYLRGNDWVSRGWWNIPPGKCATPISGPLDNRYYYYRAEVDGGAFEGNPDYTFCTTPEAFEIVGDGNCSARGYESETFAEIDVGPDSTGYTLRITGSLGGVPPVAGGGAGGGGGTSADAGLQFCNESRWRQSVSVGFQQGGDWVSVGWWNLDPGVCQVTLTGRLANRYYYYRAEIDGGAFDGHPDYTFCTSREAYEIVGDGDCEARGYETETFAEIDLGDVTGGYTVRLTETTGGRPPAGGSAGGGGTSGGASGGGSAGEGLVFCNRTADVQSLAIAFARDGDWTSLGWWNIDPGKCTATLPGPLENQYYYYRALGPGGAFRGDGYKFCTKVEAFEIIGDRDCEARGLVTADFREIDTGNATDVFRVDLDAARTGTGGSVPVTPGAGGRPPTGFEFETGAGAGSGDGRFKRKPPQR